MSCLWKCLKNSQGIKHGLFVKVSLSMKQGHSRQVLQRKRELFEEVSKGIKLAVYSSVLMHKTDCLETCPTEMVLGIKIWAA